MAQEPKKAAQERLQEDVETMGIRLARVQKQETALREQAGPLQQKIQAALGAA